MGSIVKRQSFIDNAKAFAILLVLIGHTDGIPKFLEIFIYSFHIPAFFFLSGYLVSDNKLKTEFGNYAINQLKGLVIPYIVFGLISLLYATLNNVIKFGNINIPDMLVGLLYGNSEGLKINIVLWFFTCLYVTSMVFFILSRFLITRNIVYFSLLLCVLFFTVYLPAHKTRPPWNLDLSVVALVFYASGKYLSEISIQSLANATKSSVFAVLAPIILSLCYFGYQNGRIDMAFLMFKNPLLFFINSFMGISALLIVSILLPDSKFTLFLSKNTIVIFPLHPIIFSIFTGIGMILFKLPHSFQDSILFTVLYTCGAITICYPISLCLFTYVPFVVGGRKKA